MKTVSSILIMNIFLCLSLSLSAQKQLKSKKVSSNSSIVTGFADLHLHLLFHLSSGGVVDMSSVELPRQKHYTPCSKEQNSSLMRKLAFKYLSTVAALFLKRPCHNPKQIHPNWTTLGAQQAWLDSLRDAHKSGLSLAVVSLINSRALCEKHKPSKRQFIKCDDTSSIQRQLDFFHQLNKKYEWMELALGPEHAKEIIRRGHLAIVLSIEASDLFEQKNWKKQADSYFDQGIRSFQIVHMFDNRFSGAAIYRDTVKLAFKLDNHRRTGKYKGFKTYIDKEVNPYITKRKKKIRVVKNKKGLTQEGRELIQYMSNKGYLIDLAHASEKSVEQAASLLKKSHYPFYISHGHPREIIDGKMGRFEKSTNPRGFELLKEARGVFGLRTFYQKAYSYPSSGVANNCHGSSKSLAQAISYIENEYQVPVMLATDLNGMIQQTKPRYDRKDCPHEVATKQLRKDFDYTGLGHIGQVPDLIHDLDKVGADTHGVKHSTDEFIKFWQRSTPKKN